MIDPISFVISIILDPNIITYTRRKEKLVLTHRYHRSDYLPILFGQSENAHEKNQNSSYNIVELEGKAYAIRASTRNFRPESRTPRRDIWGVTSHLLQVALWLTTA